MNFNDVVISLMIELLIKRALYVCAMYVCLFFCYVCMCYVCVKGAVVEHEQRRQRDAPGHHARLPVQLEQDW